MFPYPSGRIHMGHVRNYTMGDVVARFKRARGMNVLHPMGWDAFGMPAENAAMERKVHPKQWTYANIAAMKKQLQSMGLSLDWSREIATCDPSYYKHQQRMFLDFLKSGLVERKQSKVNWDPVDMTVLANEQVIDGRGWRSGALVEQRELTQWFFKISDYSEELLGALNTSPLAGKSPADAEELDRQERRPARALCARSEDDAGRRKRMEIFTTRPDTLFGAKFMAIAPDIRWRRRRRRTIRRSPSSSTTASTWAPPRPRSTPRRSSASTPTSARCIRSTRRGSCPCTSRSSS